MEENKKKQEKLSYEELNHIAGELSAQNQKLLSNIHQLQEALQRRDFDYTSFFVSMLFKVMEHPEMYSTEFVSWTSKNIESALYTFAQATSGEAEKSEEKPNEAE